jgi:sugar O-acyltransferase (sialic acid O-acetyltransferase NeuD family)
MKNILIVGASNHGKVIADIVMKEERYKVVGFLDSQKEPGTIIAKVPVLGCEEDLKKIKTAHNIYGIIIGIGLNHVRESVYEKIREYCPEIVFVTAIHPSASIASEVYIGEGTVIMSGVSVNTQSSIGRFCIINTNASVDHDNKIGDFASLAPGVVTGGNVKVGRMSAVSLGANIIHGRSIGEHTVIGAGATVLKDIPESVVAYGTPAKVVRKREYNEPYL